MTSFNPMFFPGKESRCQMFCQGKMSLCQMFCQGKTSQQPRAKRFWVALLITLLAILSACAGEAPDALVKKLQAALDQSDATAALALGDFAQAPPEIVAAYMGVLGTCTFENRCTVRLGPVEAPTNARLQFKYPPLGTLQVAMIWRKDQSNGGNASMPYALVDGSYQIVYASYAPAELEKLRARTTEQLMADALQSGIPDLTLSAKRSDWKAAAQVLPVDGGGIGRRFQERAKAIYKAANEHDIAALIAVGGSDASRQFYAFDAANNPLPSKVMALKLCGKLPTYPSAVKILGGYARSEQEGRQVLLLMEATLPNGWIQRGPVLINEYADSSSVPLPRDADSELPQVALDDQSDQASWHVVEMTIQHPR